MKQLVACVILLLGAVTAFGASYQQEHIAPKQAIVLTIQREQWQALTAACATPAFYAAHTPMPLIIDDGTGTNTVAIPHDSAKVTDWGMTAATATAAIATRYWKKAELVFVVRNYEQALWVVPSATLLSAPILVAPSAALLQSLGVRQAVVVGAATAPGVHMVTLANKRAVWVFQMAHMKAAGLGCDYLVVTNPHDTDDVLNVNVQWPYLSLAAAPLAAYRHALVLTGDYTGDRKLLHALGVSLGESADKAKYAEILPTLRKVKTDIDDAARFMIAQGRTPRYLGMVGGSIELPYYICDLHSKYTFWGQTIDYVPADTPYATLGTNHDYTRFVKPDLAVGRIMGDCVLDATLQLMKTFWRAEYLAGGRYAALAPQGWEHHAVVFDGHRLNQPDEGGPEASPNEPFFPTGEVKALFDRAGLQAQYVFPRDETKAEDTARPTAPELFGQTSAFGFVQYVAHGDPPHLRIEAGHTGKDMKNYLATGPEFRKRLHFTAPTVVYVIGCNVGTVNAPFTSNDQFIPTSAVHAGAIAFLAPNKCQSICFWRYAPKGPGASQCLYFWENALQKHLPVGQALIEAKWQAYQEWVAKQAETGRGKDSDNCIEIDPASLCLFGDPALRLDE